MGLLDAREALDLDSVGSHVRLLLGTLFAFAAAALIGLGATWLTLKEGIAYGGIGDLSLRAGGGRQTRNLL